MVKPKKNKVEEKACTEPGPSNQIKDATEKFSLAGCTMTHNRKSMLEFGLQKEVELEL